MKKNKHHDRELERRIRKLGLRGWQPAPVVDPCAPPPVAKPVAPVVDLGGLSPAELAFRRLLEWPSWPFEYRAWAQAVRAEWAKGRDC